MSAQSTLSTPKPTLSFPDTQTPYFPPYTMTRLLYPPPYSITGCVCLPPPNPLGFASLFKSGRVRHPVMLPPSSFLFLPSSLFVYSPTDVQCQWRYRYEYGCGRRSSKQTVRAQCVRTVAGNKVGKYAQNSTEKDRDIG